MATSLGDAAAVSVDARADVFGELRPLYALTWIGIACAWSVCSLMVAFSLSAPGTRPGIRDWGIAVALLATFVFASVVAHAVLRRSERLVELRAREDPAELESVSHFTKHLRETSGDTRGDVLLADGDRVVAWTAPSTRGGTVVFVSLAFYLAATAERIDWKTAIAHEAGHVRAGDVRTLHRLLSTLRATIPVVVASLALTSVHVASTAGDISKWAFLSGVVVASVIALWFGWGALLNARELQADAFAATLVGSNGIRQFLASQLTPRPRLWRRMWNALLQPDRAVRLQLPALSGRLGNRVERYIGIALGSFTALFYWLDAYLERMGAPTAWFVWPSATLALIAIGYQLAWWNARRARTMREHFAFGARVLSGALAPVIVQAIVLQLVSGRSVGPPGSSPQRALVTNLIFLGMVGTVGLLVAAASAVGLLMDTRLRRGRPTASTGFGAFVITLITVAVGGTLGIVLGFVVRDATASAAFIVLGVLASLLTVTVLAHSLRFRKAQQP